MARRIFVCMLAVTSLASLASVAEARPPARGAYSTIITYPSAPVTLRVDRHGHIGAFTWTCDAVRPPDPVFSTVTLNVGRLTLRHGRAGYRGRATVTGPFGQPRYGRTRITITLRQLRPHDFRYVYGGRPERARFAFAGTVSSGYCYAAPGHGAFTLFGPIRGR